METCVCVCVCLCARPGFCPVSVSYRGSSGGGLWASFSLPICPGTAFFVPWLAVLTGGVATVMDDSALSFSVRVLHLCYLPCGSLSKTSCQVSRTPPPPPPPPLLFRFSSSARGSPCISPLFSSLPGPIWSLSSLRVNFTRKRFSTRYLLKRGGTEWLMTPRVSSLVSHTARFFIKINSP